MILLTGQADVLVRSHPDRWPRLSFDYAREEPDGATRIFEEVDRTRPLYARGAVISLLDQAEQDAPAVIRRVALVGTRKRGRIEVAYQRSGS